MKNYLKKLLLTLIGLLALSPLTTNALTQLPLQSTTLEKNYVEGEVIVKYKNTAVTTKMETKQSNELLQTFKKNSQMNDIIVEDNISNLNIAKVTSDDKTTQKLIEELSKNEAVELVEPNYIKTPSFVPNDTFFSQQWAHRNTGQAICVGDPPICYSGTNDADIDTTEMWDITNIESVDTLVAVIDSGTDYTHTDLSANMWNGTGCVDENNNTISGGCPNHGWNYVNNNNNPIDAGDEEGHGTLVSSIITSQTNNNSGGAGVSRYNHVKIMAIRFDFDVYSELKAIDFARYNGAKVINASFGGGQFSQIEKNAIDAFPGIVITASGNGGDDDIGDDNDVTPSYPCNYTSSNIICVAATDQDDNLASFSNYGSTSVDIAAPGVRIFGIYQGGYVYGSGTSFSTPFVSSS
ncbi:MAG: S8 family serine peptidase, partial [Patescibacteria group bacterium]|nr:S8 family serine peptidase [Patescibacteria group bacterium]